MPEPDLDQQRLTRNQEVWTDAQAAVPDAHEFPTDHAAPRGRRLSSYATRDLTSGSIPRNLLHLGWPQVVDGSLNSVDRLVDLFWAGRGVGITGIASIGIAQNYIQFLRLGRQGMDLSIRAMVSRSIGAGDLALANHVVHQGLTLNIIIAFITIVPGVIFTEFLLGLLGASDALIATGVAYMQVLFVASAAQGMRQMTGATLQAAGDTLTPMKSSIVGRVIDWIGIPIFMFGWLGLPAFGLVGLAIVNALSNLAGFGINSYGLFTGSSRLPFTLRGYAWDLPLMWRLIKLGIPASVTMAERSLAQLFIIGIVATFGDYALAAFALTRRVETIINLGSQGLGNAAGAIAGQSIGAGKPQRAKETLVWAVGYVSVLRIVLGAVLFAFPEFFLSIFSQEPELLSVGAVWLRILVVGFLFQGPIQVFQQTFQIAGDTFMPMVTVLATMWFVEIPLATVLSGAALDWSIFGWLLPIPVIVGLGQYGVAWALSFGMLSRLLVYIPYLVWGPWTRKRIFAEEQTTAGSPPTPPVT